MGVKAIARWQHLIRHQLYRIRMWRSLEQLSQGGEPRLSHLLTPLLVRVYLVLYRHRLPVEALALVHEYHLLGMHGLHHLGYLLIQIRYIGILRQLSAFHHLRHQDMSLRVDLQNGGDDLAISSYHPIDWLFFHKMIMTGMEQNKVGRIFAIDAIYPFCQKLYVFATKTTMRQLANSALTFSRTYHVKIISCREQAFPKRIKIRRKRTSALRDRIT